MKKLPRGHHRTKWIEEFETLRQGFKDARDFLAKTEPERISMDALHKNADRCVVELGGESVRDENT